ncbi:hypothetical protein SESBI_48267 [Sesbania bispinosa]|nr:hypothetical protein SESBI_48267 [Sesbania bispinosa]
MGMEHLAKGKGRRKEVHAEKRTLKVCLIWRVAMKAHLGVKGEAVVLVLAKGGVGLNKLVVEEDGGLGRVVQQYLSIVQVWDFK